MLDRWKPKYLHLLHIILIVVIALLAYSNSFSGPFQFDDHNIIENNYFLRDFNYFVHPSQVKDTYLYYYLKVRYISLLSFAIDGLIYGFKPLGFHITNSVIHISTGLLVYWLLVLTFATPPLKTSRLQERAPNIALVTALLFVAHPVQTQAVTYIVQRYMSLASFFYLLTLVLFIKWRLVSLEIFRLGLEGFRSIQVGIYLLALASAILGMLTKEIVFTLPFAITLYEYLFFQGKWYKRIPLLIPFFLTLLVIPLGFTDMVDIHKPLSEIFHNLSRKTFILTSVSRWDYLLTEFVVIVTYLRLLIFPVNQNLDYDYPIYHSLFNPQVFFSFLFLLSLFGLAVYLIYRYRDQAPATRLIAFGILFFFLALAVESSFMPMVDVINEHRLYLPSVGAFAAFTVSAFLLANYWQQERPRMAKLVFPVLLLMVLLFTGSTYKRNLVWQSDITLWQDVLEKSPNKARPYNEMGVALGRSGKYDKVIPYYQRAIKLNPHDNFPYVNLGVAYGELGRQAEGVAMLLKAIEIREDTNAYNNLGLAYLKQKKIKEAEAMYRKALEIHPGNATARGNLKLLKKRQQALQASESAPQATSRKLRPGQSSPGQTKAPPTHPAKKKKPPTPRRKTAN